MDCYDFEFSAKALLSVRLKHGEYVRDIISSCDRFRREEWMYTYATTLK